MNTGKFDGGCGACVCVQSVLDAELQLLVEVIHRPFIPKSSGSCAVEVKWPMSPLFSRLKSHSDESNQDTNDEAKAFDSKQHKSSSLTDLGSSQTTRAAFRTRLIKLNDDEIAAAAIDTKLGINWQDVMRSARVGPARWRLKGVVGDFAIYTRQESQRFGVLAVGVVPGCAAEILNVLQSRNSPQYEQRMAAVFEDQFKEGSFVHSVDIANEFLPGRQCKRDGSDLSELSVKTVTFNKSGWLANHEEWCYVDAVYRNATSGVMEKHMTSLSPSDIVAGLSGSNTKYFQNMTCSYLLRPGAEDGPPKHPESNQNEPGAQSHVTRVTFYGEFLIPKQVGILSKARNPDQSMLASEKTVKQRLLKLAESTSRLITLVRRQRLGLQVLVDVNKFLPPTNAPCHVCAKMLVVAKQCRLCGQGVCGDCSNKHERATQPRGSDKLQVARIRVCVTCLKRVDEAVYTNFESTSLLGPQLVPDHENTKEPARLLKDLLQEALLAAPSPSRKSGVMSVIKCMLDQESALSNQADDSQCTSPTTLSPTSSDTEYLQALQFLHVERISNSSPELRTDENRQYPYESNTDPKTTSISLPLPANEAARLRAVERLSVTGLSASAELEILCHVVASEMGCTTSFISIIDTDTFYVIASNKEGLRNVTLPRSLTMCSHTIMDNRPLMVRHPEADIRFSKLPAVAALGVHYYCAYPLTGEDDQVVGTVCCFNDKAVDVTESQFSVLKKLATTASKIVRVQSAQRQRGLSTASSSST